jgi:glutamyl endopeptidase
MKGNREMKNSRCLMMLTFIITLLILPTSSFASNVENDTLVTPYIIIGDDDRTKVVNTVEKPYSAISFLFSLDSMCTGTLIDEDKVLTAAHCVYNKDTKKYFRDNSVYPGVHNDEFPFESSDSIEYFVPKQYIQSGNPRFDYAIIKLEYPIGKDIELLKLKQVKKAVETSIRIVGYPEDKLVETGVVSQYEMQGKVWSEDPFTLYYDLDTTAGQSGAPILNENNEIIGIHIGNYRTNGLNGGVKVTKEMETFIKEALGK